MIVLAFRFLAIYHKNVITIHINTYNNVISIHINTYNNVKEGSRPSAANPLNI